MNSTFKELSFMKKILAVFLIAAGILVFGVFGVTLFTHLGSFDPMAGSSYDKGASFDESVSTNSFSDDVESDNSDLEIALSKDISVEIDSKDIIDTIDSVRTFAEKYDAIYEGSHVGNNGYGYVSFRVPSEKAESFADDMLEKYNVDSYDTFTENVSDDYDDISSRKEFLTAKLERLNEDLNHAKDDEQTLEFLMREIEDIEEELWNIDHNKDSLDKSVKYSDVYVSVVDKSYTDFHTFDGVWLAVKVGAHTFVIGVIYGLYVVLYVFLMLGVIKAFRVLFKRFGNGKVFELKKVSADEEQTK